MKSGDTLNAIVRRDIPVILASLWDAAQWQDSIADAHYRSLAPGHRTRENTAIAKRADKQRKRYIKLHDRICKANARLQRPGAAGGNDGQ